MSKQKTLDARWKARVAKIMGTTTDKLGLRTKGNDVAPVIIPAESSQKD